MTPGGLWVRRMAAADLDRVLEIAASLKDAPRWTPSAYVLAMNPANTPLRIALVGGVADGALAGFAVASMVAPQAELETIAVGPAAQRRGLGRLMLDALVAELKPAGICELQLEVRSSNAPALALYRSRGFRDCGRRPRYYADPIEDAALMSLHF